MSGTSFTAVESSSQQHTVQEQTTDCATSGSSSFGCDTGCSGYTCWPVVIFVIFAIIILIGIMCSSKLDGSCKAWSFFCLLIFFIIWAAIIWFFCRAGQHAIAWFLLLLPVAIAIFWCLSYFLASATTSSECVAKGMRDMKGNSGGSW